MHIKICRRISKVAVAGIFGLAVIEMSGCVGLAQIFSSGNTESATINYSHIISNSPRALSCVITPGGMCPAGGVALTAAASNPTPQRWSTLYTAPSADSIRRGRDFLRGLSAKAALDSSQADIVNRLGITVEQLAVLAKAQPNDVSDAAVTGASAAAAVTTASSVTRKFVDTYFYAVGASTGISAEAITEGSEHVSGNSMSVALTRTELNAHFAGLDRANSLGGWANFAAHEIGLAQVEKDPQVSATELSLAKFGVFLEEYMSSYFRNGHFIEVDLDPSASITAIETRIYAALGIKDPTADQTKAVTTTAQQIVDSIIGKNETNGKYQLFGSIGDAAFISRGGTSYSFPSVTIRIVPLGTHATQTTKIDYTAVGDDLARVFFEALGDSLAGLPADPSSTGCKSAHRLLPCFVANDPGNGGLSADAFARVNEAADLAEGTLGAGASRAIRGISWFSLNNDALADLISTSLAVTIRKATEKVAWCAYACGLLADTKPANDGTSKVPAARAELAATSDASVREFSFKIN